MKKLTEFKPIAKLNLPSMGELDCSGLIVVVGPNSSGKSQLLRDIMHKISGQPRNLVVADELEIEAPDHEEFIQCLKSEGHIRSFWNDNDQEMYIPTTTFLGTGQGSQNVASHQVAEWRNRSTQAIKRNRKNEYFGWFSYYLVTALFLENRLISLGPVSLIDFETQPPTHDLHALHLNDPARAELCNETIRAFSKAVWTDFSRGNQLCLRVSEDGAIPDAEARLSIREMAKYRTIDSEGDGMKSYVATVISILLGRRPVCVIDEPELCLHPPQAYNLGQFIGKNGTGRETATFVATHSSQVLRGIVQTADKIQVVRLTKGTDGFSARYVDSDVLKEAMKKPTVRAETILDGIFSQAVAIVESDGDRIVYQAAWEVVGAARNFDIHFATSGGTGGIADTCTLYRTLGIPVGVVADLDLVVDVPKLTHILNSLTNEPIASRDLISECKEIAELIKRLPPTVTEPDIRSQLLELAQKEYSWANEDDRTLREKLSKMNSSINRMHRLKRGGVAAFPPEVDSRLNLFISKCNSFGLFLVPVGELEEWLSECGITASKDLKWAWANEAAQYIHSNPARDDDIWRFARQLGDYLAERFG